MKAVILAGGEGSRLRPLTLGRPKPMTPLFGKPVLGHILDLLRRHGVTEAAITLRCLPGAVTDWLGDGREYGIQTTCFVENAPLGTAGSVKKCLPFLGEEDFFVVSGDAVCDLDLRELARRHQERHALASLALSRQSRPLEYGLVRTAPDGRVLGFVEKPGWGEVDTELVNTGIYVLSPRALETVPDGANFDFGKDLFPALLAQNRPLYAWEASGYWKDMGDCGAYLESCFHALEGRVQLDMSAGHWISKGDPSAVAQRPGVEIQGPCWLGKQVSLAPGCRVGPYAVLDGGSTVETGAVVERSVLLGASVREGAEVNGAIVCAGAAIHRRAMVNPGAVLGEGAVVSAEAIVAPGVKLWPGVRTEEGEKVTVSRCAAAPPPAARLSQGCVLRGVLGEELIPELLLSLGALLGEEGRVGLGWSGGDGAAMLAQAAGCGVAAAGGTALVSDAGCPSAGAWLGRWYALPSSLFVEQDGEHAEIRITGPDGLPLERAAARRLEGALLRGEGRRVAGNRVGHFETVTGVRASYAADAARMSKLADIPLRHLEVAVSKGSGENDQIAAALAALGCQVARGDSFGRPLFSADWGGSRLTLWDEAGRRIPPERVLVLLALIEYQDGAKEAALPLWAPAAAETVAEAFDGRLLRLGRDAEALALWQEQPWFWDAVFAACRICARLGLTGERLRDLDEAAPRFAVAKGEILLRRGRGRAMERLHWSAGERRPAGKGWIYVTPSSQREALRVVAEASSMEAAEELCVHFAQRIREADEA